jgi:hypothetical protein
MHAKKTPEEKALEVKTYVPSEANEPCHGSGTRSRNPKEEDISNINIKALGAKALGVSTCIG